MRLAVPVLALCLILGNHSPALAQGGSGVIVGANFAKVEVTPDEGTSFDRRTGLVGGIFIGLPLGTGLTIQPEALYSQKGVKFKDAGGETTIELDYLDVPVLARITAGGGGGLALIAGPSFGFKLRARGKADAGGQTQEEDLSDEVEPFDLGFIVGAGIRSKTMFIDGRYQWGLSNINKSALDGTNEVKNRVFSVLLGIRF
jgi:hypothetical protein